DSEIVLADGSISTIQEIYSNKTATLLTLQPDFKLGWTRPSTFVDDGLKPVFMVTTKLRRSVKTTLTHPFLTVSGWKPLREIPVGTKIAVPRSIPVFGTKTVRDCEIKLLAYLIGDGCLSNGKASFTNANPVLQREFQQAVYEFGGTRPRLEKSASRTATTAVAGDTDYIRVARLDFSQRLEQHVSSKSITQRDLASAVRVSPSLVTQWKQGVCVPSKENFASLCTALEIEHAQLAPGSLAAMSKNSKNPIVVWLDELGLWGKTAHTKTIPDCIFTMPREQTAQFLNRLFATDGWATVLSSGQAQIEYATVSRHLAEQIQHLLLRFGIIAKLRQRSVKYKNDRRVCFQLDITDKTSLLKFASDIGIFGKENAVAKVAAALLEKRDQTNCDLIPIEIWDQLRPANAGASWSSLARRSNLQDHTNLHVGKRALSRPRLMAMAEGLDNDHFRQLATSDIYWDEVVSIEPMGMQQVYDLTIPETHNFVANDICVHNTAFVLNIAQHAAVEGNIPVALFSLEMSKEQLVQRMLCSEANIDANRLRTGHMHTNDWTHLATAMGRLGEAPIFIDDSAAVTALDIRAKCRRLKAEQKGLGLVIIDYIQLMSGRKATDNRVQEVSEISRSLKTLAREIGVPVIALSQLSRAVEARQNKRPMLSDLRESGSIEQDADIVMFIYRDEYYNAESDKRGEAEIIIAKQRNGPVGTVDLLYQSSITKFLNKVHNQYTAV
ncbi:MAG TPA: DnaB-like helicase C-terminal domain-containing protein, partial [Trichormus sp.]